MSQTLDLLADLAAEQEDLARLVAAGGDDVWTTPTPAVGWDVRDQIAHLALVEDFAVASACEPQRWEALHAASVADGPAFEAQLAARGRALTGPELLAGWADSRARLHPVLAAMPEDGRLPWFGPSMGVRSFARARVMETWAHGDDVRVALGAPASVGRQLQHVAHLGVQTFGWSHVVRGEAAPSTPLRVELAGPAGATWTWGPEDAVNRVTGDALQFCRVVTQRAHVDDTDLPATGPDARHWLEIAQAFAGPPTLAHRAGTLSTATTTATSGGAS